MRCSYFAKVAVPSLQHSHVAWSAMQYNMWCRTTVHVLEEIQWAQRRLFRQFTRNPKEEL